ncbi:MAG: hypothetical protein AAF317_05865, partial [Pseudomonadota bacterium]
MCADTAGHAIDRQDVALSFAARFILGRSTAFGQIAHTGDRVGQHPGGQRQRGKIVGPGPQQLVHARGAKIARDQQNGLARLFGLA